MVGHTPSELRASVDVETPMHSQPDSTVSVLLFRLSERCEPANYWDFNTGPIFIRATAEPVVFI